MADVQVSDQLEVSNLLTRYALGLDSRDWELLASCFTDDGVADFGEMGGVHNGSDALVAFCRGVLSGLDASQHLVGSVSIECHGDEGSSVCYFQAQHVYKGAEGGDNYLVGGTYRDRLVRTGDGWRIAHRTLEASWFDGNPAVFELAAARWAKAA